MSSLKQKLSEQIKTFMKSGDKQQLGFARNLHAAIRKKEVDERVDLDDPVVQKIVTTLLKQRQEGLVQFEKANRQDLVEKEQAEIQFLRSYLPEPLSDEEINAIIDDAIAKTQAVKPSDIGKVLKLVLGQTESRADASAVSLRVKQKLQS